MTDLRGPTAAASVTSLLEAVELRGRTWCYVDLAETGGYSVKPSEAALLHVVLSGQVVIARTGGEPLRLSEGEGVIITSGEAHAVRASSKAAAQSLEFLCAEQSVDIPATFAVGHTGSYCARLLTARLRMTWPEGLSRGAFSSAVMLGQPASAGGSALTPTLLQHHSFGPGATVVMTRLASAMLADALRREMLSRKTRDVGTGNPLEQARRLVEMSPGKEWTVETLARSVGMGRSNFSAQFTRAYEKSPMEFVTEVRMQRASEMLRHGTLPIPEIAEAVGYGCESAFNRRFSKHFGITPTAMRMANESGTVASPPLSDFSVLLGKPVPGGTAWCLQRPDHNAASSAMAGGAIEAATLSH